MEEACHPGGSLGTEGRLFRFCEACPGLFELLTLPFSSSFACRFFCLLRLELCSPSGLSDERAETPRIFPDDVALCASKGLEM